MISVSILTHIISVGVIEGVTDETKKNAIYNTVTIDNVSCDFFCDFNSIDMSEIQNVFIIMSDETENMVIVGWFGEFPENWFPLGEGRFIQYSGEAYTSMNVVNYSKQSEQTIIINNKQYTVVGSTDVWAFNLVNGIRDTAVIDKYINQEKFVFIPLSDVGNMEYNHSCVRIQFKPNNNIARTHMDQWMSRIIKYCANARVYYPENPSKKYVVKNIIYSIFIGIICIISYLNLISAYWYSLEIQKRKYRVMMLNGATTKDLFLMIITKFVCLFSVSFFIAFLLAIFMKPLLIRLEVNVIWNVKILFAVYIIDIIGIIIISIRKVKDIVCPKFELMGNDV